MAHYLDASALTKLVVAEPETAALRGWLDSAERLPVASGLVRTELLRAVRRFLPERLALARAVLDAVTLLRIATPVLDEAGRLDPPGLRSLDAVHLATALDLGDDLEGLVTYDDRLADAAGQYGIRVVAPA
ncbi:MAG TPA: type II toxin-antitoxin system VapC family toxin [Acidimicrobiales bacterium]|nr:type II toxin-antitoxin system VapC family toxin [Acidimicrobiales bacterium]